ILAESLAKASAQTSSLTSTDTFMHKIGYECLKHLKESIALSAHWATGFTMSESTLRLNPDIEAKKKPSIKLGCWLLDLLLGECPDFVKNNFYLEYFDAIVK